MALGNTTLLEYGIRTEQSDMRAHVCPVVRRVYVYGTAGGLAAIDTGTYREVPGYQANVPTPTARGYLVPPMAIPGCVGLELRSSVWDALAFVSSDGLSQKGGKALRLVMGMIRQGLLPLPSMPKDVGDFELQVKGMDITIMPGQWQRPIVVQVKCDYKGGAQVLGGTGYLFLQTAECNPLGYH